MNDINSLVHWLNKLIDKPKIIFITVPNDSIIKICKKCYISSSYLNYLDEANIWNEINLNISLCQKLILLKPEAIKFLDKTHLTYDMCKILAANSICYIPQEMLTQELCDLCVNMRHFDHIPENFKTINICKKAVFVIPSNIEQILNPSEELCLYVIKRNPNTLENIKKEYQTEKICKYAVSLDGRVLKYVSEQTLEICEAAVYQTIEAFLRVKYQSTKMAMHVVSKCGGMLSMVYDHLKTPDMCKIAVSSCGYAIEYVPIELKTKELYKLAVCRCPIAIREVYDQTFELCMLSVRYCGLSLRYIKNQTFNICLAAVKQDGNALQYVNDKTDEICYCAWNQNKNVVCYMSLEMEQFCKDKKAQSSINYTNLFYGKKKQIY
jgi:hypothetical protein